jgi:predicted porin
MNKKLITLAIAGILATPTANAYEIIGKKLEIYGKMHVSADSSDDDKATPTKETSFSSNSSRLGFKGTIPVSDDMSAIYKVESEITLDEGGDSVATRNAYAGLKTNIGTFLLGKKDTPFKTVASKWGIFGDSIGDRRAILGAGAQIGNKMNNRAMNGLTYMNKFGAVKVEAVYSTDADGSKGSLDSKDEDLTGIALFYKEGSLSLAAGYEKDEDFNGGGKKATGWRVSGGYKMGKLKFGLIYEDIRVDGGSASNESIDRSAWGVNAAYRMAKNTTLKAQFVQADDHEGVADSGANMMTLGVSQKLNKYTSVYAAYTQTDNDTNAKYQGVDGGHGDEVKTENGKKPKSFSVGLIFKF